MSEWSHLANASHIDWVLRSLKDRSEAWDAAWNAAMNETCNAACNAAWYAAWDAALEAALDAHRLESWNSAWNEAFGVARNAALGAMLALAVYDDCDQYLSMTYEQLHAWAILSEVPQAVLLLPLKWVQEHEQQSLVTTA